MLRNKKTSLLIGLAGVLVLAAAVLTGCASSPGTPTLTSMPGTTTGSMMGGTTGTNGGTTGTTTMPGGTTGMTTVPGTTAAPGTTTAASAAAISNGRSIYLYGTSDSGSPITYTDGPTMMQQPGRITCASCHGADGQGSSFYVMMESYSAPNITWTVLSGPDPDMQHPPYTVTTLKRAITEGLDPGGSPLNYPMPHWQMSQTDLNDLVAYLMTLK